MEAGCLQLQLEKSQPGIHLPAMVTPQQSHGEDQDRQGTGNSHHTQMAIHDLVPDTQGNGLQQPHSSPMIDGTTSPREQPPASGSQSNVVTTSLECQWQQAITTGADPGVILQLFDSKSAKSWHSKSTPGQRAFAKWMEEQQQPIKDTRALDLMNFLHFGLESRSWKPQTARTYLLAVLQYFLQDQQQEL